MQRLANLVDAANRSQGSLACSFQKQKNHFDVEQIVKCLCAAMQLKDRASLGMVLRTALESLPEFRGFQDVHFTVPSKSTLSSPSFWLIWRTVVFGKTFLQSLAGLLMYGLIPVLRPELIGCYP